MQDKGYERCDFDHYVYFKGSTCGMLTWLLLFVDDMLMANNDQKEIKSLTLHMSRKFATKVLVMQNRFWVYRFIWMESMESHG